MVGEKSDFVANVGLFRYVDMPLDDEVDILQTALKLDKHVNSVGNNFFNLCKENHLRIVNGILEPGFFTCYTLNRNNTGSLLDDNC